MSTILKALRRLEQEKAGAEPGRPLREQVAAVAPGPPARSGRTWLTIAVAVVLSASAGGGAIWWAFGGDRRPSQPVASAMPSEVAEAPSVALRPEPRVAPAAPRPEPEAGPPSDAFASDVGVVPRPDPLPRIADAAPLAPRQPPTAGARRPVEDSAAAARNREAALRARERRQAEQLAAREPEPVDPPVAKAPEPEPTPAPPREPAPAPQPTLAAAPVPAPPAPEVLVEKTRWHPLADRRLAWVRVAGEARRVVEGDVVEGMLVGEIQPSGVVFEHDGEPLRRGVGER